MISGASRGSTARIALTTFGEAASAGNSLSRARPRAIAAKASVGVKIAGQRDHARSDCRFDDRSVEVGGDDQLAAGIADPGDVVRIEHRPGADQRAVADTLGEPADAVERARANSAALR